jgi:hypothetical protein
MALSRQMGCCFGHAPDVLFEIGSTAHPDFEVAVALAVRINQPLDVIERELLEEPPSREEVDRIVELKQTIGARGVAEAIQMDNLVYLADGWFPVCEEYGILTPIFVRTMDWRLIGMIAWYHNGPRAQLAYIGGINVIGHNKTDMFVAVSKWLTAFNNTGVRFTRRVADDDMPTEYKDFLPDPDVCRLRSEEHNSSPNRPGVLVPRHDHTVAMALVSRIV